MELKNELTWWDTADTAIPILLNMIPKAGFIFSGIYSAVRGTHKEKRLKDLMISMQAEMEKNQTHINSAFVSKEDFLDLLEETTKKIVNERTELKRIGYKNILMTGMVSNTASYDDVEENLQILNQLNESHLLLLKFFDNPHEAFAEKQVKYQGIIGGSLLSIFKQIFSTWRLDFLEDQLADLSNLRLIRNIVNDLQTMRSAIGPDAFANYLSARGSRFVAFVMKPH
jgi:hypothetical protein